jgi:hypothetical protein
MAWIEVHQSLLTHRKTLRACKLLGCDMPLLVGHLVTLWLWAMDNADADGGLGDMTPGEIGAVADWDGDGERFVDALVRSRFLDLVEGSFKVHNWYMYTGKIQVRREANRQRVAEHRERRNAHVTVTSPLGNGATYLTQPTNLPTQPTSPTSVGAMSLRQLEMKAGVRVEGEAYHRLVVDFTNLPVWDLYRDWLLWVGESEERRPRDPYAAFKGFLRKKETA